MEPEPGTFVVQSWLSLHVIVAVAPPPPHQASQGPVLVEVSNVCIQSVAWAKPTLVEQASIKPNKAEGIQRCSFVTCFILSPLGG